MASEGTDCDYPTTAQRGKRALEHGGRATLGTGSPGVSGKLRAPYRHSEAAAIAARAFEALGIPYLVGGSVASTLHGEPRATQGADFAVHLEVEKAQDLADSLSPDFYVDVSGIREAAAAKRMFNAIHNKAFVKIDVHVREASGHSAEEIRRATVITLPGGGTLRVATPEDTILRKLWWYRAGDEVSDRQWRDVLGVLRTAGQGLDMKYIVQWAETLGVSDLVDKAARDA